MILRQFNLLAIFSVLQVAASERVFHNIFGAVLSDRVSVAWAHMGYAVNLYLIAACLRSQPDHQLL
jgi:hypothetical protein